VIIKKGSQMGNQKSKLEEDVRSGVMTMDEAFGSVAGDISRDMQVDDHNQALAIQCADWMKGGNMDRGQLALCCNQGCAGANSWQQPSGDGCGHDGHQYTGQILKRYPESGYNGQPHQISACDCQKMCAGNSQCAGWQVTADRHTCQLKKAGGNLSPLNGWRAGMMTMEKDHAIAMETMKKFCAANQNGQCKTVLDDVNKERVKRSQVCVDSLAAYQNVQKNAADLKAMLDKLNARQAKSDATIADLQTRVASDQHSLVSVQTQRAWVQSVVAKAKTLSPSDGFVAAAPEEQVAMINTTIDGFNSFGVDPTNSVAATLNMSPAQRKTMTDNCKNVITNLENLRDSVYWWRTAMPMQSTAIREAVDSVVSKAVPTFVEPLAKSVDMGYAAQESNIKDRITKFQATVSQANASKARAQTDIDKITSHSVNMTQSTAKAMASVKTHCKADMADPQGCWNDLGGKDHASPRAMTMIGDGAMYAPACFAKGATAGYTYVGLQAYHADTGQAWCFGAQSPSDFQRYGAASGDCSGGGAGWVNSVYKIK